MLAGGQGALQARHCGGVDSHAFGDLGLGQPGFRTCLEQRIEQGAFFAFNALNLGADGLSAATEGQPPSRDCDFYELAWCGSVDRHGDSFGGGFDARPACGA